MPEASPRRSDLGVRVVTALVLAAIVLGTLASGSAAGWALLVAVFALVAAWETARLLAHATASSMLWCLATGSVAVLAAFLLFGHAASDAAAGNATRWWLLGVSLYWLSFAPFRLASGQAALPRHGAGIVSALLIGAAALSLLLLQRAGVGWLLGVLVVAVVADVAGYFVGRRFGRVKLAPEISPGKTREGAYGGLIAAGLWALVIAALAGWATDAWALAAAVLAGVCLGGLSIVGDLWESQLKRRAGAKDSSHLLPGHGGVLDRVDAQLPVLPAATSLLMALGVVQ